MRFVGTLLFALILDISVILSARKIILDFLRGSCSKKTFRQVIENQPFAHKLSLSFIGDYINNPEFIRGFTRRCG